MSEPFLAFRQRLDLLFRPEGTLFYGWKIVGVGILVQYLGSLLWMQAYGAYTVLLQEEFGWSMTTLSVAFALTRIESGLLGPLQGWLVDRYGPRKVLSVGMVLFGGGMFFLALTETVVSYYVAVVFISLGASLGGFHTLMVAIVHWFSRHRTKAVAWTQMGYAFGGLSIPMLAFALEQFGWRMVATGSGVILFLIGLPLVQYIRHDPEEVGEKVDGIRSERLLQSPSGSKEAHSMTWREALKTPAFWLISAGHGIALLTVSTVIVHLIPFLTRSFEMSLTTAGVVFGTVSTFQFVGQLFGGYLGDRFDKRLLCVGCMLAHGSGLLILVYFENLWMTLLFSLLHGLAWGIRGPLMVALRADYFGSKSFGLIMGISSMIVMLGTMGGPVISGVMVDHFGDYRLAFQGIALSASIGAVCFWAARKPKRDELEEEGKGEERG